MHRNVQYTGKGSSADIFVQWVMAVQTECAKYMCKDLVQKED